MRRYRKKARLDTDLCSGPAKLCESLGIDRRLDGVDLIHGESLFLERVRRRAYPLSRIVVTARVGVDSAGDWAGKPLRFYLRGNPHVSRT